MGDLKPFWQSKTLWGAAVTLVASGLTLGKYSLTPADIAQATDLISGVAGAVGGFVAIYGRVVASKQITATTPA